MEAESQTMMAYAGLDPWRPYAVGVISRALIGTTPDVAQQSDEVAWTIAKTGRRISLRIGTSTERGRYLVARELCNWWLIRKGSHVTPSICQWMAAAVLCPRMAVLAVIEHVGCDYQAVAKAFAVPEPLAFLRIGEVTGESTALVDHDTGLVVLRGKHPHGPRKTVALHDDRRLGLVWR